MTTSPYQAPPLTASTLEHAVTVFRFDDGWSWARIPALQAKGLHEFAPSFVDEHPLDPTPRKLTSNPFAKHSLRKLWFVLVDPLGRIRALFSLLADDGAGRDSSATASWFGHNFALSDATIHSLEMLRRMVTLWLDVVQPRGAEDLQGTSFSQGSHIIPTFFSDSFVERAMLHDRSLGLRVPRNRKELFEVCTSMFEPDVVDMVRTEVSVSDYRRGSKYWLGFVHGSDVPLRLIQDSETMTTEFVNQLNQMILVRSPEWPEGWGWRPVQTFSEALRQLALTPYGDSRGNLHPNAFVPRSTYLDLVEGLRMPGTVPFDVSTFDLLEVPSPLACQDDVFFPWVATISQPH